MGGWDFQARIRSFKSEKFKKFTVPPTAETSGIAVCRSEATGNLSEKFKKFTVPSTDKPKCKQAFMAAKMWKRMQAFFAQGIINRACDLSLAKVFMSDRLFFP